MLQSFIALGVISLLWVIVGFSLCFGTSLNGLIGDPRTYGRPRPEPEHGEFMELEPMRQFGYSE